MPKEKTSNSPAPSTREQAEALVAAARKLIIDNLNEDYETVRETAEFKLIELISPNAPDIIQLQVVGRLLALESAYANQMAALSVALTQAVTAVFQFDDRLKAIEDYLIEQAEAVVEEAMALPEITEQSDNGKSN